ncbi:MAG: pitrilysin family protein [Candidatus Omnitrophota bacterium]
MQEVINIGKAAFIFAPFKGVETASLGVFFKTGSRFEPKRIKGIAHFLEHMVFKGSKKYSHLQIKREIEGRGGSLNAFTSQEVTAYYAHFLSKNLPIALDILLNMALEPLLKKEDIDKERNVILEEIKMYNDLPASRAGMLLDKLLWPKHALGEEIIGYTSTVKDIVKKDLSNFRDKYYTPSNMVVSFAGSYSKEKIISLLSQRIEKPCSKLKLNFVLPPVFRGQRIKVEKKNLQQTHLCLGFRSISYLSRQRAAAQLISVILGANMSSRLFEELREKRPLCYDISTEVRKYRDSGAFVIHMGLDKSKIIEAIGAILKELNKIKEKEAAGKELSRAKDYLLGQAAMALEQPQGKMFYLAEGYLAQGKIYDFEKIKKEIESVTSSQIKKLAEDIFKFENLCISCVGDIPDTMEEEIKGSL